MKICIVGAGAIGGYMGVKLALAGQTVSVLARGAHLGAIKERGLMLRMADGEELLARDVIASDTLGDFGVQDVVVLAVKAHQIESIAAELPALFDDDTIVIATQNGIPWWYFDKHGGEYEGTPVKSVDPQGIIRANIESRRIIGCIAYPAAALSEAGVIEHIEGNRFPVGELDGTQSARVQAISRMFIDAGMKSPILKDIRSEIWLKLWGNLSFNPISALAHSTLVDICQFPLTRELVAAMMGETQTLAEKLGIHFRVSIERRIDGAEKVGKHKTSMLQDAEAGKAMEVEALIGAVVELGRLTQTPMPHVQAVYACISLLANTINTQHLRIVGTPLGE